MIKSKPKLPVILLGGDIIAVLLITFFTFYLIDNEKQLYVKWELLTGFFLLWVVINYREKLYKSINFQLDKFLVAYLVLGCFAFIISYVYPEFAASNQKIIVAFTLAFPVLSLSINHIAINVIRELEDNDYGKKKTLVAGVGRLALNVEKELRGNTIKGFIKCNKEECKVGKDKVIGDLKSIHEYLRDNPVDEIVIALPLKASKKIRNIVMAADYYGVRVKYVPDYQSLFGKHYKTKRYGHIEAVNVRQLPLDESYSSFIKNSFDKVFSILAILFLLPVYLTLAVLIKLETPGPVFYCPIRIGKAGKPFRVFKFRSMRENDATSGGILSTAKDDDRITRVGRVMRKYSLDELPQFFNVLIGNMSVVGPRPHRSYLNQQLQESEDKYMIRHYFKPGITGWAQVNGWRGPTETKEQKRQRTVHDIWYMENWSFMLDIKIVFLTVFGNKVHKSAF